MMTVLFTQPTGKLTQAEHYELASLLVKAGYRVSVMRLQIGKRNVQAIEIEGDMKEVT